MKIHKTAALLAGAMACTGFLAMPALAVEDGLVYDGEQAQYIQNGEALTGRFTITPQIMMGDADSSAEISAPDAALVLIVAAESAAEGTDAGEVLLRLNESFLTPEAAMAHADCNSDGDINAADASEILVYVAEVGAMGTAEPIGVRRYYADTDGILQTGWITDESGTSFAEENFVLRTDWLTLDGKQYYFNNEGILQTGWLTLDHAVYYCGEDGAAHTGWLTTEEGRYYFDANGAMQTGLTHIGNTMYYFDETGAMQTGWVTIGDATYNFNADGTVRTGWLKTADASYYFSADGVMQTGLLTIEGKQYYFDALGMLQTGWIAADGGTYYAAEDGVLLTGMQTIDGVTYYFDENGMRTTGWVTLNDSMYYFSANDGGMIRGWANIGGSYYYFHAESGVMQTGLITVEGKLYYLNDEGVRQMGWHTVNGDRYYFLKLGEGAAAKGIVTISNVRYYFDPETGILLQNGTKNGITTNANGVVIKVMLDVTYISQIGYPTGCESASAVMLLRDAGYDTSIDTFIDTALDKGSLYTSGGTLYGPHPDKAFIGDPRSSSGFGCYAPVITTALNRILTGGDKAVNITGTPISTLLTDYIDKGIPVGFWATINMIESTPGRQWIVPDTGELFTWKRNEHCLVLVGYDADYYYFNDPYKGNGLKAYARSTVEARYATMGYQAVVIEQAE